MKYFLDTEFIEDGKTIDLISIGIISEDGRELYAQLIEADYDKANAWVQEHVITRLTKCPTGLYKYEHTNGRCRNDCPWEDRLLLKNRLLTFIRYDKYSKPEFWGYYADYDWVVLCQLFGRMIDLPKNWPMYCNDVKQLCVEQGDPDLTVTCGPNDAHNALDDARWIQKAYAHLMHPAYTAV